MLDEILKKHALSLLPSKPIPNRFGASGEPHLLMAENVLDELLQHLDSMISAHDLRVHGENECASRSIGPLEFRGPDLIDLGRRGHAPVINRGKSEKEMRGVIELP